MERPIGDCKTIGNPAEHQLKPLFPTRGLIVLTIFYKNAIIDLSVTCVTIAHAMQKRKDSFTISAKSKSYVQSTR